MYKKTTTVEEFFDSLTPVPPKPIIPPVKLPINVALAAMGPVIRLDGPLLVKLLTVAKDENQSSEIINSIVTRMIDLCARGMVLELIEYESIMNPLIPVPTPGPMPGPVEPPVVPLAV
jgi:hypothetical protein